MRCRGTATGLALNTTRGSVARYSIEPLQFVEIFHLGASQNARRWPAPHGFWVWSASVAGLVVVS